MTDLSQREMRVFVALANGLFSDDGEIDLLSACTDGEDPRGRLREQFYGLPDDASREEFRGVLRAMDRAVGGMLLYGRPRRFIDLRPREAESALRRMAASAFGFRRRAFQAIKRLLAIMVVTTGKGRDRNAVWDLIGYPGPEILDTSDAAEPHTISCVDVRASENWTADVVVVGSGAGGGTAAAVLAESGLDVVVLEKGPYLNETDFTHLESEAYRDLYMDGNLAPTKDLGIGMTAGRCLGGGTMVNYTVSLATPDHVRAQWDHECGFADVFMGDEFEASSRAVHKRLAVNTAHSRSSTQEALMETGLRRLGWHVGDIPRNVVGCPQDEYCGYCTMGCRRGATQNVLKTWLGDAARAGARIVVQTEAQRILVDGDRAVGVEAAVGRHRLTVRARAVVVAAGGLYTPALLARSGAGGPAVGQCLWLHPTTAMWGKYPQSVRPWTGTIHSTAGELFADLDGDHFGVTFEVGPSHPGVAALSFGWESRRQYVQALAEYPHWSAVGVRLRDRDHGRVVIPKDGRPRWQYRLSRRDKRHIREGLKRAAEVHAAAGATEVMTTSGVPVLWRPDSGESVSSYIERIDSIGYDANGVLYASYHQMGSARMGSNPRRSVVDENNEVHDTRGLHVMDASAFPATSGVNPMISIETIAHRAAGRLADRLV